MKAMPRARHQRSAASRSERSRPATQTGDKYAPDSAKKYGSSAHRGADVPEPPLAIECAIASSGQPYLACQARYGVHIASAIAPPAYIQGDPNGRRGPPMARATTTA